MQQKEEKFSWKRARNTEPEQLLALEIGAITSTWAKLDEVTWKDRVLLPGTESSSFPTRRFRGRMDASPGQNPRSEKLDPFLKHHFSSHR